MLLARSWIVRRSLTLASLALCVTGFSASAQDQCAAPGPCYSCVPNYSCAPGISRAPAAPQQMTVQRAVMQQETVMVPMTVMMPQVVYRQRIINELVQAAPALAPQAAPFIPPAPAAELPAAAPQAAPQMSLTRDCAGSPSTQMALVAALMMNNRTQASARAPASPSPELRDRVARLETKMDRLIEALEKKRVIGLVAVVGERLRVLG